jgi:hypothetical protein
MTVVSGAAAASRHAVDAQARLVWRDAADVRPTIQRIQTLTIHESSAQLTGGRIRLRVVSPADLDAGFIVGAPTRRE